jgi:hypothetical protein
MRRELYMTEQEIWDCETQISELLDCEIPRWIDQDITGNTVISICQGGCASGAYMPAVTYYQARETMGEHGDDVLQYIEDSMGELPAVPSGESWSGIAVFYLSVAVELWAASILSDLESHDLEESE